MDCTVWWSGGAGRRVPATGACACVVLRASVDTAWLCVAWTAVGVTCDGLRGLLDAPRYGIDWLAIAYTTNLFCLSVCFCFEFTGLVCVRFGLLMLCLVVLRRFWTCTVLGVHLSHGSWPKMGDVLCGECFGA